MTVRNIGNTWGKKKKIKGWLHQKFAYSLDDYTATKIWFFEYLKRYGWTFCIARRMLLISLLQAEWTIWVKQDLFAKLSKRSYTIFYFTPFHFKTVAIVTDCYEGNLNLVNPSWNLQFKCNECRCGLGHCSPLVFDLSPLRWPLPPSPSPLVLFSAVSISLWPRGTCFWTNSFLC